MPPISALPAAPDPNDRSTFNARAYPWSVALNGMTSEINAVLPAIDSAFAASAAAIAAANYKGLWSSLSGALAIPATVFHNNSRWMLLQNLANVTTEVPGVSSKWASLSGTVELISTTNASAAANVEWSNFAALSATYDHLVVHASNVLGSAATGTLTGQIRQSSAWQTATWTGTDLTQAISLSGLSSNNQLTNVAKQAMALQINVRQLGVTAVRHIDFVSSGGAVNTGINIGHSSFDATIYAPTTPIQGLRIFSSTGNISGVFRLYGVRK